MKNCPIFLLTFLIALQLNVQASGHKNQKLKDHLFKPDYVNLQYAGNLGLASVGVGYISKNEKHHLGINYGYLPEFVNSVKVHTFTLKGAFQFKKHKLSEKASMNAYIGSHLLYSSPATLSSNFRLIILLTIILPMPFIWLLSWASKPLPGKRSIDLPTWNLEPWIIT